MSKLKNNFAKIISRIFDPIFEGPILILLATQVGETKLPWKNIFFINLLLMYILPIIVFFISLKKGWIADLDITKRKDRYSLFTFIFICLITCLLAFYFLKETMLFDFYLKLLIPVFIFFLTTFFWKISGHMLMNSIFILLLYFYFNTASIFILGIFLLIAVGWSRIFLKKHTLTQVLAGGILPFLTLIF